MFDTFFKEFTTQSNTAWKKQRTAYIRWECLIRSLKSSLHNQIQPTKKTKNSIYTMKMLDTFFKEFTTQSNTAWKKQRTAYIRWECLIRSLKSSLHNQIQPEKKCCVGYTNIIET
jgi:predicted ATP-grasp superfamily ATP-dependent carboligase